MHCNKLFLFNCELMTFGASVCLPARGGVKVGRRDPCARFAGESLRALFAISNLTFKQAKVLFDLTAGGPIKS